MEYVVQCRNTTWGTEMTIEGNNLVEAIKRNFSRILERSTRGHISFGYPMTAKLKYVQTLPDGAQSFKVAPDGTTTVDNDTPRGHIELRLEWTKPHYRTKLEEAFSHTVYINGDASYIEDESSFVILGN
ncbi:hypothetical protein SAMN04487969_102485 [Paenibacillus algorifonticola]|uniref:Uncharacterized protein n=1 Tax=Paenibacillus algorifonticola TaxID=684063 RepID=A0A1I2AHF0_9BACL|nr:hypothetical protein [Paenibacillus algorifonticola]SFE43137.1 hypothetical protein SAMN04487969_102485 [Paenibacillus algorifonticola]